jgi:hypothetical protein
MLFSPFGVKVCSNHLVGRGSSRLDGCIWSGHWSEHPLDDSHPILARIEYKGSDFRGFGTLDDQSSVRRYLRHLTKKIHESIPPLPGLNPLVVGYIYLIFKDLGILYMGARIIQVFTYLSIFIDFFGGWMSNPWMLDGYIFQWK